MSPLGMAHKAAKVASAATLRKASLTPDDVIVLAAVEATNSEPGRQLPGTCAEISSTARMHAHLVNLCLEGLVRHRLLTRDDDRFGAMYHLTGLGREVLAELIRRERRGRPRVR